MRETIKRRETVKFICDNQECRKEEVLISDRPDLPLGWIQFMTQDCWLAIQGKSLHLGIEIQACSWKCFYIALEELFDDALNS